MDEPLHFVCIGGQRLRTNVHLYYDICTIIRPYKKNYTLIITMRVCLCLFIGLTLEPERHLGGIVQEVYRGQSENHPGSDDNQYGNDISNKGYQVKLVNDLDMLFCVSHRLVPHLFIYL